MVGADRAWGSSSSRLPERAEERVAIGSRRPATSACSRRLTKPCAVPFARSSIARKTQASIGDEDERSGSSKGDPSSLGKRTRGERGAAASEFSEESWAAASRKRRERRTRVGWPAHGRAPDARARSRGCEPGPGLGGPRAPRRGTRAPPWQCAREIRAHGPPASQSPRGRARPYRRRAPAGSTPVASVRSGDSARGTRGPVSGATKRELAMPVGAAPLQIGRQSRGGPSVKPPCYARSTPSLTALSAPP